ncbi:hypothetical protein BAE44_0000211 [Dichanthelium oligosanthes]|uniref:Uncharacterized protein n=1 Tax=Dichanthelium oligosanthes TaxID=888268 RepID=A0A1E5WNP4_9POAL|nr:hypothetical protein BAE44_0000211 [Dichanthelium oligosanthes]
MYATKPLSLFKSQPEAASGAPPEGQNSGYLVLKGADDEETRFWGLFPDRRVRELPFPQNCVLKVQYTPLASNRYYAVIAKGKRKGLVRACSREEDMGTCCFCQYVKDVEPRPFDPADIYQQVEIVQRRRGWFTARAVAPDAFPSSILRHKYCEVYASKTKRFDLGEAVGVYAARRSRQLTDTLPVAAVAPTAVVGKWYSPFFLVKEASVTPREQMERSAFFEVTLDQRWEPLHADGGASKLASKKALIGGVVEAKPESLSSRHGDAYVWFKAAATGQLVGVCTTMWERMRWEQHRGGWVDEEEDAGKVSGGSVFVERFVVKRLDGSVFNYHVRHQAAVPVQEPARGGVPAAAGGRNSGYLVVKGPDDDGSDGQTCCWGTCGGTRVRDVPLPQNRVLTLRRSPPTATTPSSPRASTRGLVRVCSREGADVTTFCFCRCVDDVEPRSFDPANVYQQMKIVQHRRGRFTARAVAADGIPPFLYRRRYWRVYASRPRKFRLDEAPGLDAALRSRQQLTVTEPSPAAAVTAVGKWYCPFFLIREGGVMTQEQMERSTFYEVALEQRWEPTRADAIRCAYDYSKLASKKALIGGSVEAELQVAGNTRRGDGGHLWFRAGAPGTAGQRVGVCTSVWERMLWEESRGEWVADGSVLLVERFVVRRIDRSVHHDHVRFRAEQV